MRKLILIISVCLLGSIFGFAQNKEKIQQFEDVTFYGVDFSIAKTFGTDNTVSQFKAAFEGINSLFLSEAKKYDVAKYFKLKNELKSFSVKEIEKNNENIKEDFLIGTEKVYTIAEDKLASHIKSLPVSGDGVGLVFVAELLDKSESRGTYHVVFFDIASKNILETWKNSGKAKGFGLRNYWAGSVYDMMKSTKIK